MKKLVLSLAKMLVIILVTTTVANAQFASAGNSSNSDPGTKENTSGGSTQPEPYSAGTTTTTLQPTYVVPNSCNTSCPLGNCEVSCVEGTVSSCSCTSGGSPSCTCGFAMVIPGSFKRTISAQQASNRTSLTALAESFRTTAGDNFANQLDALPGVGLTDYTGYNSWLATYLSLYNALSSSEKAAVDSWVASH